VDGSGHPKLDRHTVCIKRQWCGNTGKKDNCVVSVRTGYTVGDFQCLLDSDLYLPQSWADNPEHCKQANIRVFAWTFDEWYGRDGTFLDGLHNLGQNYVAEAPTD